jgi:hypothetical protein
VRSRDRIAIVPAFLVDGFGVLMGSIGHRGGRLHLRLVDVASS